MSRPFQHHSPASAASRLPPSVQTAATNIPEAQNGLGGTPEPSGPCMDTSSPLIPYFISIHFPSHFFDVSCQKQSLLLCVCVSHLLTAQRGDVGLKPQAMSGGVPVSAGASVGGSADGAPGSWASGQHVALCPAPLTALLCRTALGSSCWKQLRCRAISVQKVPTRCPDVQKC